MTRTVKTYLSCFFLFAYISSLGIKINILQFVLIFSVRNFYPNMYAFWLLNDDELFDSFNSNMTRLLPSATWYSTNTSFDYPSPVPSFTGKYALNFQSSYVLQVCHSEICCSQNSYYQRISSCFRNFFNVSSFWSKSNATCKIYMNRVQDCSCRPAFNRL